MTMKSHPAVKLNICYKTMEDLMEKLAKRELDFVLSFRPSSLHPEIESHILFATVIEKGLQRSS